MVSYPCPNISAEGKPSTLRHRGLALALKGSGFIGNQPEWTPEGIVNLTETPVACVIALQLENQ